MSYHGNTTKLRYFKTVCEFGTITKAAEALNISQPSLTAAIKELEKELGIDLFHRAKNTLRLTEHGELIYAKTTEMLDALDRYYKEILEYGNNAEREITIGIIPMAGAIVIPQIFGKAREQLKGIDFRLQECATYEALTMLDNNIISVAILIYNDVPREYNHKVVHESEIQYWVNRNHPLAGKSQVNSKDIGAYPLVMLSKESYPYRAVIERFKNEGVKPDIKLLTSQLMVISKIIEKNNIGTVTYKDMPFPEDSIAHIPLSPPIQVKIAVVWGKNDFVTSVQKQVINFLCNLDWHNA